MNDPKQLLPAKLTDEAERSETGARNVLLSFVRAIEEREFQVAWAVMEPDLRANTSPEAIGATFADFGRITASAPSGTMGGAAGSSYYEAPVTFTGSNGARKSGTLQLRRVNDVDGSSAYERRWHVSQFKVD